MSLHASSSPPSAVRVPDSDDEMDDMTRVTSSCRQPALAIRTNLELPRHGLARPALKWPRGSKDAAHLRTASRQASSSNKNIPVLSAAPADRSATEEKPALKRARHTKSQTSDPKLLTGLQAISGRGPAVVAASLPAVAVREVCSETCRRGV